MSERSGVFSSSHRFQALSLAVFVLACGCDKPPEPSGAPPMPSASPSGKADEPPSGKAEDAPAPAQSKSEITWNAPGKWKQIPNPSAMRIATYLIPRAKGDPDDGELSVSRAGGSIDANIDRWKAQFNPVKPDSAKQTEEPVSGLRVIRFEVAGTYAGMMPRGPAAKPKENWALMAAIVEVAKGEAWFFKLTGPEKTIMESRADFDSLVSSFRPK